MTGKYKGDTKYKKLIKEIIKISMRANGIDLGITQFVREYKKKYPETKERSMQTMLCRFKNWDNIPSAQTLLRMYSIFNTVDMELKDIIRKMRGDITRHSFYEIYMNYHAIVRGSNGLLYTVLLQNSGTTTNKFVCGPSIYTFESTLHKYETGRTNPNGIIFLKILDVGYHHTPGVQDMEIVRVFLQK